MVVTLKEQWQDIFYLWMFLVSKPFGFLIKGQMNFRFSRVFFSPLEILERCTYIDSLFFHFISLKFYPLKSLYFSIIYFLIYLPIAVCL